MSFSRFNIEGDRLVVESNTYQETDEKIPSWLVCGRSWYMTFFMAHWLNFLSYTFLIFILGGTPDKGKSLNGAYILSNSTRETVVTVFEYYFMLFLDFFIMKAHILIFIGFFIFLLKRGILVNLSKKQKNLIWQIPLSIWVLFGLVELLSLLN